MCGTINARFNTISFIIFVFNRTYVIFWCVFSWRNLVILCVVFSVQEVLSFFFCCIFNVKSLLIISAVVFNKGSHVIISVVFVMKEVWWWLLLCFHYKRSFDIFCIVCNTRRFVAFFGVFSLQEIRCYYSAVARLKNLKGQKKSNLKPKTCGRWTIAYLACPSYGLGTVSYGVFLMQAAWWYLCKESGEIVYFVFHSKLWWYSDVF